MLLADVTKPAESVRENPETPDFKFGLNLGVALGKASSQPFDTVKRNPRRTEMPNIGEGYELALRVLTENIDKFKNETTQEGETKYLYVPLNDYLFSMDSPIVGNMQALAGEVAKLLFASPEKASEIIERAQLNLQALQKRFGRPRTPTYSNRRITQKHFFTVDPGEFFKSVIEHLEHLGEQKTTAANLDVESTRSVVHSAVVSQ